VSDTSAAAVQHSRASLPPSNTAGRRSAGLSNGVRAPRTDTGAATVQTANARPSDGERLAPPTANGESL